MADQKLTMDSKERVALDLMGFIHRSELNTNAQLKVDRAYVLTLYSQCLQSVNGYTAGQILGKD